MGLSAGAIGLGDLLAGAFGAAPEIAAAAAPEAIAAAAPEIGGAIALPEIAVTAPAIADLGATIGPGVAAADLGAAGAGAAEAATAAGAGAGLGGLLGISPAGAGGLSPASIVSGEFNALKGPQGGTVPGVPSTPVHTVPVSGPVFGAGAAGSPLSPGAGDPLAGPANTLQPDTTTIGPGTGPGSGSAVGLPTDLTPTLGPGSLTGSTASSIGGGAGDFFKNNAGLLTLLGLGVGGQLASPFISNALGLNKVPGSQDLKSLAQTEASLASTQQQLGQQLQQPLITGQLPPGAEAALSNALRDATATIKSRYASLGLSNSTMEADAIANAEQQANAQRFTIAQQMAQTGASDISSATQALGLESTIYDTLLQTTLSQDEALGNAISNFASSVGGGTALGTALKKTTA